MSRLLYEYDNLAIGVAAHRDGPRLSIGIGSEGQFLSRDEATKMVASIRKWLDEPPPKRRSS